MAGGGGKPKEGKEEVVTVVENLGIVRGEPAGVRVVIQGDSTGGTSIWIGDVGDDPPHGIGPGEV